MYSLEKSPYTFNGENVVNTLGPSFLIGSSSFFLETRLCINARTSSNLNQIRLLTMELPAFEHLKNQCIHSLGKSPYTFNGENVVNTLGPSF